MGYHTDFRGRVAVSPPLNAAEVAYLTAFNSSRRWDRPEGAYSTDDNRAYTRGEADRSARPPTGQPGLWCPWTPTPDGTALVWDEGEKPYDGEEWMRYLIGHFLRSGAEVQRELGRRPSAPPPPQDYVVWLAGFFDGEGCVSIVNTARGYSKVQVSVTQITEHRSVLKEIESYFGGGVYEDMPPGPEAVVQGRRPMSRWQTARQSEVVTFLGTLLPHLRVKAGQAKPALESIGVPRGRGETVTKLAVRAGELGAPEFAEFTFNHLLTGGFHAGGEERSDVWSLLVRDNVVTRASGHVPLPDPDAVEYTVERVYPAEIEG